MKWFKKKPKPACWNCAYFFERNTKYEQMQICFREGPSVVWSTDVSTFEGAYCKHYKRGK